jgi:uncharacterized membrane protein (DUF485 family)
LNPQQLRIYRNPKLAQLVRSRQRLAWTLTLLVLGSFFCYLMAGILRPHWLARPLYDGTLLNVGGLLGAGIIVMAWLATGVYAWFANTRFDRLSQEILQESVQ